MEVNRSPTDAFAAAAGAGRPSAASELRRGGGFGRRRHGHREDEQPEAVLDIKIEPEVFASKDQEMLQDLLRAAVNEASRRVDEELANQMRNLAGGIPGMAGLKIPGLF